MLILLTGVMGSGKTNYLLEKAQATPDYKRLLVKFDLDNNSLIISRSGLQLEADLILPVSSCNKLTKVCNEYGGSLIDSSSNTLKDINVRIIETENNESRIPKSQQWTSKARCGVTAGH